MTFSHEILKKVNHGILRGDVNSTFLLANRKVVTPTYQRIMFFSMTEIKKPFGKMPGRGCWANSPQNLRGSKFGVWDHEPLAVYIYIYKYK